MLENLVFRAASREKPVSREEEHSKRSYEAVVYQSVSHFSKSAVRVLAAETCQRETSFVSNLKRISSADPC